MTDNGAHHGTPLKTASLSHGFRRKNDPMSRPIRFTLVLWLVSVASVTAQPRWWMNQPVRLLQTNLRETDSALDA